MDCIGASKGLFGGLLVLVGIIICLVLFFVLVSREGHRRLAIFLADTSHAVILLLMMLACLIGFVRYWLSREQALGEQDTLFWGLRLLLRLCSV